MCSSQKKSRREKSRRAVVSAVIGVGSLFRTQTARAAPSPTNLDDMEARKMARDEMLKAARAKAAAEAAAQAKPAAQ